MGVPLLQGVLVVDSNEVAQGALQFRQHGAQGHASPGRESTWVGMVPLPTVD